MSDVSEAIRQFENSPGWWDEAAWERVKAENARLRERIRLLEDEPCPDCNGDGHWGKEPDGRYRSCETCGGHEDRLGSGKLHAPMLDENARLREQAEALAAALETALYYAEMYAVWPFDRGKVADARAALRAYREPWATVHTKYLDDQLVERCITCLERWPCKEDNHDDRR